MITSQEKKVLYMKKLKEGMTLKEINKYFEKFINNLKFNKRKSKIDIKNKINPELDFRESFKNLKVIQS